jgi:hypothetical protein
VSDTLLGLLAALVSGILYAAAVTLQALEAREAPESHQLRAGLLVFLIRRRRWVLGTALGVLGWPLQAVALALAPVALVQPALASGLIALLIAGRRVLGESPPRGAGLAVGAIVAGIALLAFEVPEKQSAHTNTTLVAITMTLIAILAIGPFLLRERARSMPVLLAFAAGAAYVWVALATTLLDDAIGRQAWLIALVWVAGVALLSGIGGVSEMTSFQLAPASRVAPIVFACEMVVPALLSPIVNQHLGVAGSGLLVVLLGLALVAAGVTVLSRTRAVGALTSAAA